MAFITNEPAVLLLDDGTAFWGQAAGKIGTTTGEICFNTGMTGYQELFTDPSYFGQIMVTTNVHIGNYGVKGDESQADDIMISGLVCRNFTEHYSRKQADSSIQQFLLDNDLTAITGVDTRAVVNHIRHKGAMNAIISSEEMDLGQLMSQLKGVPGMAGLELSSRVTAKESYTLGDKDTASHRIAVLDLGIKRNILNSLVKRGALLKIFPAKTSFGEIAEWKPDAFFISNGPGDPSAMPYAVSTAKEMLTDGRPMFGICLGHQILAQAAGLTTYKMHNGHRGLNHPVKNLLTGKCEITSQNHGFAVSGEELKNHPEIEVTHLNLNDDTVEGLRMKGKKAFSVQYHPEAAPGPHDATYLFDEFLKLITE